MSVEAVLVVVSDRAARGERADETAATLRPVLMTRDVSLVEVVVVEDERGAIAAAIRRGLDKAPLVLTTGGTGIAPRDVTPEATRDVIDVEIPGLGETMRRMSAAETIHAVGSRALAGAVRGRGLVVNLPGRPAGAAACFGHVAAALPHLVAVATRPVSDASHEPPGP